MSSLGEGWDEVISEELLDRFQPIAVVVPCYHWVSTAFLTNFVNVIRTVGQCPVQITKGVYTAQAMRLSIKELLRVPTWKRLVIVEADMILPPDALLKHSLHTDPVVGSVYFQHSPPYHLNFMVAGQDAKGNEGFGHLHPKTVKLMLDKPNLYRGAMVGLGCTSVAREVFENWPEGMPYFRTDFAPEAADDPFTQGEISHDAWWCMRVREQGYEIFIDTSIICHHLTEGMTGPDVYLKDHAEEFKPEVSKLIIPRSGGRVRVAR